VYDVGTTDWIGHVIQQVFDGSACGVVLRWVDSSNYIYCEINSSTDRILLIEVVAGVSTTLQNKPLNPGTLDTYDMPDGEINYVTFRSINGNKIIVNIAPGTPHDARIEFDTTRFANSEKCGVYISKGTGVSSATAEDLVIFTGTQTLPDFSLSEI
jgi:hypothetical protein